MSTCLFSIALLLVAITECGDDGNATVSGSNTHSRAGDDIGSLHPYCRNGLAGDRFNFVPDGLGLRPLALWDVERSRELGTGSVLTCGFWFPDGRSYGGKVAASIQIFDFSQESWVATACQFAGRDLSADEWARFGPDKPYRKTCPDL